MDPADPVAALVFQHVDVRIDGFLERAFDMRARSLRRFPRGLAVERLKCDGADAVPAGIPLIGASQLEPFVDASSHGV